MNSVGRTVGEHVIAKHVTHDPTFTRVADTQHVNQRQQLMQTCITDRYRWHVGKQGHDRFSLHGSTIRGPHQWARQVPVNKQRRDIRVGPCGSQPGTLGTVHGRKRVANAVQQEFPERRTGQRPPTRSAP